MIKLTFKTTEEFEDIFKARSKETTDAIKRGIEKAMKSNRKSALLFLVSFETANVAYEISLPQSEWKQALTSCLDYYHIHNHFDEAIDAWELLEIAKVW